MDWGRVLWLVAQTAKSDVFLFCLKKPSVFPFTNRTLFGADFWNEETCVDLKCHFPARPNAVVKMHFSQKPKVQLRTPPSTLEQ